MLTELPLEASYLATPTWVVTTNAEAMTVAEVSHPARPPNRLRPGPDEAIIELVDNDKNWQILGKRSTPKSKGRTKRFSPDQPSLVTETVMFKHKAGAAMKAASGKNTKSSI